MRTPRSDWRMNLHINKLAVSTILKRTHHFCIFTIESESVRTRFSRDISRAILQTLYMPFPSSLVPLFQSESKCETILMKMALICERIKLHAELIFIWKVLLLDSFWNRGTRELGNGLFFYFQYHCKIPVLYAIKWSNMNRKVVLF